LCGDEIEIQLLIKKDKVEDIMFKGHGCAISVAATSLLTDKVKGLSLGEINKINKEGVLELIKIPIGPVRLKCALLGLDALKGALKDA